MYNVPDIKKIEWLAICYIEGRAIPTVIDQIFINGNYNGSKTYEGNKQIANKLINITNGVNEKIGVKYNGGYDFCIQNFENNQTKIYRLCHRNHFVCRQKTLHNFYL